VSASDSSDSGERRREPPAPTGGRSPASDDAEDALDLSDLEKYGVEGVVARLDDDPIPGDPVAPARVRRGRSTVLSVIITVIGLYLLVDSFSDFRYWLRSGDPEPLGEVAELAKHGTMPDGLHDRYVTLHGTPDVRNAARMTLEDRYVGYVRLVEGGGSLFAAVPREKDEKVKDEFEGTFTGRMKRLRRDAAYPWLEQYVLDNPITRTIDAEVDALWAAIGDVDGRMEIETSEGRLALEQNDRVRVIVQSPDARVQIGTSSVRKVEDAEARVAALGLPYAIVGSRPGSFHSFVVRVPPADRDAVLAKLQEGLEDPSGGTDPKRGAVLLPGSTTLIVPPAEIALSGDDVVLPLQGGPLYEVEGGKLVPRAAADGRVRIPKAWVQAVRIERPIALDPNGYVVMVGDEPGKHWRTALMWLVVVVLVGLNAANLWTHLRRRAAA